MSGYHFKDHCYCCYSLTDEGSFILIGCANVWLCSSCFAKYQKIQLFEPDVEIALELLKNKERRKK